MDGLTIIVCIILHYLVDLKAIKYRKYGVKKLAMLQNCPSWTIVLGTVAKERQKHACAQTGSTLCI